MDGFIDKEILPDGVSPKLLMRHSEALKSNPESEVVAYFQAHELYMYEFFRRCRLSCTSRIEVNGIKGVALSPVEIGSFTLGGRVDEEVFFRMLLKAPVPFLFLPEGDVRVGLGVCEGMVSFKNGILMDLGSACAVGVEFIAAETLETEGVHVVYIGLMCI